MFLNPLAAAILALAFPAAAQAQTAEELLAQLSQPDLERWQRVERQLVAEWSKSGSPAMDLLLQRGRDALDKGDTEAAIEHLTALTDHAPEFAEGWATRATAFFSAGMMGQALHDLGRALTLNPSHFGALTGLGIILDETGREARALEAFRAAVAIHPHHPRIRGYLDDLERRVSGRDA